MSNEKCLVEWKDKVEWVTLVESEDMVILWSLRNEWTRYALITFLKYIVFLFFFFVLIFNFDPPEFLIFFNFFKF